MNASKLLDLLSEEGERWEKTLVELEDQAHLITGNVFVASSTLSYLGPFSGRYRSELEQTWIQYCSEVNVKVSENY